jgi:hypothetical protein
MAAWLGQKISADDRFDLVAPAALGLVCFRLPLGDDAAKDLMCRINDSGLLSLYLTLHWLRVHHSNRHREPSHAAT